MERKRKGAEFLDYVAMHGETLMRNLRKNVKFEDDLFMDVYQETVVSVYEAIVEKGVEVRNIEKYFFKASVNNYLRARSERDARRNSRVGIEGGRAPVADTPEDPAPPHDAAATLARVERHIEATYGHTAARLFMAYYRRRVERGFNNYKAFAAETGLAEHYIGEMLCRINRNLRHRRILNREEDGMDKTTQEERDTEGRHTEG